MPKRHVSFVAFVCLLGILGIEQLAWSQAQLSEASGYQARRLPLPPDVLPSCLAVRPDGTLVVGSMDGEILLVVDSEGDGILDRYQRWAGTLPHWPLGMIAEGDDLIVATRSALLRLSDEDGDGWAERWVTITDEWDVTRDHHDWTTGIAVWPDGSWVVSPVTDDVRERSVEGQHHLRGKAIKVNAEGEVTILAEGLRYPTGWATRADGLVVFTDNQGQQKTNCEVNVLVPGHWYGYPSQADPPSGPDGSEPYTPSILIPYPWGRSVNGLAFAETGGNFGPLEGQLVLCEYNNRFLARATLEEVEGVIQGACYPFLENLLGPLCAVFAPDGTLYVGSLREPSWGGEPEQGALYQVTYTGQPTFGIERVTAEPDGFTIHFFTPVDPELASDPQRYSLRRYRHVFQGAYHSPPTDEQALRVSTVHVADDGRSVRLVLREPHLRDRIYEIRADLPEADPDIAFYTMNQVPNASKRRSDP